HFDDRYIQPGTTIIQVDIEGRDIGRYYPVAVGIQADARETCLALSDELERHGGTPDRTEWRREAEALRDQRRARLAKEAALDAQPMKPQRVYAELRRALPPETIGSPDARAPPAHRHAPVPCSPPPP